MIDELVERFVKVAESAIAAGDWEAYGSVFAEDLLMVTPSLPGITRGREARVQLVQGIMDPFPDGVVKVQRSFGRDDWACLEVLFTGTHTEPMPGPGGTEIPPTNKAVKLPYCMVMKFKDGLASELYEYYDQVDLLTQLGLM
jgi:ketosteroid isomerase-like protein